MHVQLVKMPKRSDVHDDITAPLVRRNLKAFREAMGLSLAEAAARMGISMGYLDKIERGERAIPGGQLLRTAAAAYGHRVDDLYEEKPPPADAALVPAVMHKILLPKEDAQLVGPELQQYLRDVAKLDQEILRLVRERKGKAKKPTR